MHPKGEALDQRGGSVVRIPATTPDNQVSPLGPKQQEERTDSCTSVILSSPHPHMVYAQMKRCRKKESCLETGSLNDFTIYCYVSFCLGSNICYARYVVRVCPSCRSESQNLIKFPTTLLQVVLQTLLNKNSALTVGQRQQRRSLWNQTARSEAWHRQSQLLLQEPCNEPVPCFERDSHGRHIQAPLSFFLELAKAAPGKKPCRSFGT